MEYSWEVLNIIQPSPLPPNCQKMFLCRIIQWNIFLFRRTLHKYVLNIFPVSKKLDEDLMKYYLLPDYDNKVLLWLMKTFHPEEQLILIYRLVFPNFYYFQTMKDLCLVLDSELFPHLCSLECDKAQKTFLSRHNNQSTPLTFRSSWFEGFSRKCPSSWIL